MKAAELLKSYETGQRDFRGECLRGNTFKGKDLSGADFSEADIRGANFTNANLTEAKFIQSKAGLQRHWVIGLSVITLLLSAISGFILAFTSNVITQVFLANNIVEQILTWVGFLVIGTVQNFV